MHIWWDVYSIKEMWRHFANIIATLNQTKARKNYSALIALAICTGDDR